MNWSLLWLAVGLALVFEGLPYFLFPDRAKAWMRVVQELEPSILRWLGLGAILAGMALLLLGRSLG